MLKFRSMVTLIVAILTLLLTTTNSFAMGSDDPYQNAQVGLTYQIYKPTYTAGLILNNFKLLNCGKDEMWLAAKYGEERNFQLYLNDARTHCSNPGLARRVLNKVIKGSKVSFFVFCPVKSIKCSIKELPNYGGYAITTLKGSKFYHISNAEILVSGINFTTLEKIILNLKPLN